MVILDLSKAFDTVPHQRLLGKLSFYGIKGVVDGMVSGQVPVVSRVPQGSLLVPLLFRLHINDLPSVATSQARLFADDCLLHCPIRSMAGQEAFQCDLEALEQWASTW